MHSNSLISHPRRWARWPPQCFVPALVFLVVFGLTTHAKYSVSGDEPHYLMIAESLLSDGDLDVSNNYRTGSGVRFGHEGLLPGSHVRVARDGSLMPVHDVGLPVLLLPVYAMAGRVSAVVPAAWMHRFRMTPGLFAYSIVSAFLLAMACTGLSLLGTVLTEVTSAKLAWGLIFVVGIVPPFLSNAFLVYPEIPAFFACCLALWAVVRRGAVRMPALLAAAAALGVLPWFHRKFALFVVGLVTALALTQGHRLRRLSRWRLILLFAALTIPQALLCAWTLDRWGNLGGPLTLDRMPFSWGAFRQGMFGLLIDRENGLFVWAPVFLIAPCGWWLTRRITWPLVLPVAAVFIPAAAHDQWWGGFSPVGRFLLPVVPCVILAIAPALEQMRLRRSALFLLFLQLPISAYAWHRPRVLWPQGDGRNALIEALPMIGQPLAQALPSFRTTDVALPTTLAWATVLGGLTVILCRVCGPSLEHRSERPR